MGLMDILNGMQNGPGGRRQPTPPGQQHGMSPWMIALLGLLAYKAMHRSTPASVPQPAPPAGGTGGSGPGGGGLGDILGSIFGGNAGGVPGGMPQRLPGGASGVPGGSGGGLGDILGGLLGGAGAGTVLNGGLGQIINDLQRSGQGRAAQSWVGRGENEPVAPDDLRNALGGDTIEQLSQHTGMPQEELLQGLSQNLPELVDQLTPDGRLPTEEEASRW
jgi:uncharacterized protein YidB (DUF937 family)